MAEGQSVEDIGKKCVCFNCNTNVKWLNCSQELKVPKANVETDQGEMASHEFSYLEEPNGDKWILKFKTLGAGTECKISLSLDLVSTREPGNELWTTVLVAIIDSTGMRHFGKKLSKSVSVGNSISFENFVPRSDVTTKPDRFLPNDVLSVHCELWVIKPEIPIIATGDERQELLNDVASLLKDPKHADVVLRSKDNKEFLAHKSVLSARSAWFKVAFAQENSVEASEKIKNRTRIDIGVKATILQEMLGFIYTATAPNLDQMACDLLAAADEHKLPQLKLKCQTHLIDNMTVEMASDLLVLSDRHSAPGLKNRVVDFMVRNVSKIVATNGWAQLVTKHPKLMENIILLFAAKEKHEDSTGAAPATTPAATPAQ